MGSQAAAEVTEEVEGPEKRAGTSLMRDWGGVGLMGLRKAGWVFSPLWFLCLVSVSGRCSGPIQPSFIYPWDTGQ